MIGSRWIFVGGFLFAAASNVSTSDLEGHDSGIKFDLEAAIGMNDTEMKDNIQFLDKLQKVIVNMKSVFETRNNIRRSSDMNFGTFSDFIQISLQTLNEYNDFDLKNFLRNFHDEAQKYHYQGCTFHELRENDIFKTFLNNLLFGIKTQSLTTIRSALKAVDDKIKSKLYDRNEEKLVKLINSLYKEDSLQKMQNFLINIDAYRLETRKDLELGKIIKDGLRSIIFDHFTELNHNSKRALKSQLNEYRNNLSPELPLHFSKSKVKKQWTQKIIDKQNSIDTTHALLNSERFLRQQDDQVSSIGNLNEYAEKSIFLQSTNTTRKPDTKDNLNSEYTLIQTKEIDKHGENVTDYKSLNLDNINKKHSRFRIVSSSETTNYEKNNRDMKYETDAYEYLTSESHKQRLTFKTLYPQFLPRWTEADLVARRQLSSVEKKLSQENDSNWLTNGRRVHGIHLVKELDATVNVGMRSSPA